MRAVLFVIRLIFRSQDLAREPLLKARHRPTNRNGRRYLPAHLGRVIQKRTQVSGISVFIATATRFEANSRCRPDSATVISPNTLSAYLLEKPMVRIRVIRSASHLPTSDPNLRFL